MTCKKLGFGCMRLPLENSVDQKSIDRSAFSGLIDLFMDNGGVYFDTAYFYHGGESESAVGECLVKRHDRESFLLADKLPLSVLEKKEDMERIFEGQLEKCGVSFFDYYLLHNINGHTYQKVKELDAFAFALGKKAEGKIKRLGFSFHGTPELLEEVLEKHPESEFVQLQLNYLDWEDSNVQSRRCYEIARRFGKDVIVMEPCKGGELSTVPDEAKALMSSASPSWSPSGWAFRFAAGLDGVIMVLSGMNTPQQVAENTAVFDALQPLSADEQAVLAKTVDIISAACPVKCTGCRYCESGCPMNIPIPDCFSVYNRYSRTQLPSLRNSYGFATAEKGKAKDCIGCRACTEACPQNLDIPELLKAVSAEFDK